MRLCSIGASLLLVAGMCSTAASQDRGANDRRPRPAEAPGIGEHPALRDLEKQLELELRFFHRDFSSITRRYREEALKALASMPPAIAGERSGVAKGKGRFGVTLGVPAKADVEKLGLPPNQGLIILKVEKDSAADKAGIKENDVLLDFNGRPVPNQLPKFKRMHDIVRANTPVEVIVLREGKMTTLKGLVFAE